MVKPMRIKDNMATLSKYEILEAFFRTEDEENIDMADELNRLINVFYEKERLICRNITELSFDIDENKDAIEYIKNQD